jgi:hypothetical protein
LALIGWDLASEARTSYLQSRIFSHFARQTSFSVEPGPSETIVFPKWGPYDALSLRLLRIALHGFAHTLGSVGTPHHAHAEGRSGISIPGRVYSLYARARA